MRLDRIPIPPGDEQRAWEIVRAAFAEREPVSWPRRHARPIAVAIAAAAIAGLAASPPGQSVIRDLRDAIGRERVVGVRPAHRELVRLPAPGRLLIDSPRGPWVIQANGSRRLLGPYSMASWSPHGLFVAAIRDYELYALDPQGNVRWSKPRKQKLASPRWSFEGFRIAYLSDASLRVITGDGVTDWSLGAADASVAPAWRPQTHQVAFVGADSAIHVADVDARRLLWKAPAGGVLRLAWSGDGRRLLAATRRQIAILDASGRRLGVVLPPRGFSLVSAAFQPGAETVAYAATSGTRSRVYADSRLVFSGAGSFAGVEWSPDGAWLLIPWPAADEWVFVRPGLPRLVAVAHIARQFDPAARTPRFPLVDGWCCPS